MKQLLDRFSIIVVGCWNPRIFTPEWLKQFVCVDQESVVEYAIPVNNPDALPRIGFENIYMFVDSSRIEVKPANSDIGTLEKCSSSISSLIKELNHTPVSALGVNFSFIEEVDADSIISKFGFNDLGSFDSEIYTLNKTTVTRSFSCKDGGVLNLSITIDGSSVVVDFNYHFTANKVSEIISILDVGKVNGYYSASVLLMKNVYSLEIVQES